MKVVSIKLTFYIFLLVLVSCQNTESEQKIMMEKSLSSDDGKLDLSLSTLEQQNIEKEKAKESLLKAREKRTIIQPKINHELTKTSEVNIVLFARQTKNEIGDKLYNRILAKRKNQTSCLRFVTQDDAQRFFLEKNGPEKDHWNLDPDGDGFACDWDPEPYRSLIIKQNK